MSTYEKEAYSSDLGQVVSEKNIIIHVSYYLREKKKD